MDVGFSKDQIVVFNLPYSMAQINFDTIKEELLKNPQVLSASSSNSLPNNISSFNRFDHPNSEGPLLTVYTVNFDYNFVDLYEIELIQGRNFSKDFPSDEGEVVLINEAAAKALNWESPLGQRLKQRSGRNFEVIGLLKDFNFHSLHNNIKPLCLFLRSGINYYLSLKINTLNIPATLEFIKDRMKTFSGGYPIEYRFFDDVFDSAYRTEQKLGRLFVLCAVIAIFIACIGLFGLVAFIAEQRTKEIGIRKVMGATVSNIIQLLSLQFLKWILLANIIAWPIAYFAMHKWLENFAFRVNLGIGVFTSAALIALFITLITLSYQSIKSASANPVDSLRYE